MRWSTALQAISGIDKVALMMGTPANRGLMIEQKLWDVAENTAGPMDLCMSISYERTEELQPALEKLEELVAGRETYGTTPTASHRSSPNLDTVHSWKEAAYVLSDPKVAAISVPGAWAAAETRQALDEGFHVFLYSDNVSIDDEVFLKQMARDRHVLLMGPDCGTALWGGVPLGFINRVTRGPIGLIAASGTGAQEVSSALDRGGLGVSHILGIGSRDLTAEVRGLSFRTALEWLAEDTNTAEVGIIAKPPDPGVLNELLPILADFPKPLTALFLGRTETFQAGHFKTVSDIAALIHAISRTAPESPPSLPLCPLGKFVRGLFVGGTLAIQASRMLGIPLSNEGLTPWVQKHHVLVDLGDDRFTVGRPHPMMEGTARGEAVYESLMDPDTGIVVGDIVLGDGAESDPVAHVIGAVERARTHRTLLPTVVFTVVGTRQDPQDYEGQVARLRQVGVWVTDTSTAAIEGIHVALGGH